MKKNNAFFIVATLLYTCLLTTHQAATYPNEQHISSQKKTTTKAKILLHIGGAVTLFTGGYYIGKNTSPQTNQTPTDYQDLKDENKSLKNNLQQEKTRLQNEVQLKSKYKIENQQLKDENKRLKSNPQQVQKDLQNKKQKNITLPTLPKELMSDLINETKRKVAYKIQLEQENLKLKKEKDEIYQQLVKLRGYDTDKNLFPSFPDLSRSLDNFALYKHQDITKELFKFYQQDEKITYENYQIKVYKLLFQLNKTCYQALERYKESLYTQFQHITGLTKNQAKIIEKAYITANYGKILKPYLDKTKNINDKINDVKGGLIATDFETSATIQALSKQLNSNKSIIVQNLRNYIKELLNVLWPMIVAREGKGTLYPEVFKPQTPVDYNPKLHQSVKLKKAPDNNTEESDDEVTCLSDLEEESKSEEKKPQNKKSTKKTIQYYIWPTAKTEKENLDKLACKIKVILNEKT